MSQGTLYINRSPRNYASEALISYFKLDVKIADLEQSSEFASLFPLKQAPAFLGPKGLKLTEALAIQFYLANQVADEKERARLLGSDVIEKSQILRWASLANSDVMSNIARPFLSFKGLIPYNKKDVDTCFVKIDNLAAVFDARLRDYTFVATENISLGDLHAAGCWAFGLATILGPEWRAKHPHLMRWFNTVAASPIVKTPFAEVKLAEKALTYTPPKKQKAEKPKAEKPKAEKKKDEAKPADDAAPAKKPKHPLEALGKSTFVLDDWKRKYSNDDTRPVALPWFWEHYNPEEYSIWKVGYKYNDELTLTFMSNNLVGGFFNRLSASTKYMFGCLVVYGENNNNGIVGAVMVRGQDFAPAFDVAPDWESYEYTKLDPTKEEDKEFVNNMWAWDKPVVVNGEDKEIVDGKVLK
ncbi:CGH_3_HP_G0036360.mRNA.1.CDS.1 [Saccharomyces cerevisiae]|nr:CGH_3_HP_G0036360.mRNA.1.CDS.1 [Saccharomyces cerevisiae]CAI6515917.1 CGH_3_HP_G0036360.mRNA.1.CDS.1 [Saccharomyces cerevisiae]